MRIYFGIAHCICNNTIQQSNAVPLFFSKACNYKKYFFIVPVFMRIF